MMEERLQQAAERLGQGLRADPAVGNYLSAQASLEADLAACGLLDELASRQAELRMRQQAGPLSQEDLEDLRQMQERVLGHPLIAAYQQAQQELLALLPRVNAEISQLLGLDFAGVARPTSCCG